MIGIFIWTMIFLFAGVFIGYAIGSYLEMQKQEEPRAKELKSLEVKKMSELLESVNKRDFDRRISEVVEMLEEKQLYGTISLIKDLKHYLDLAVKEKTSCNCQHNNNPRDNEPCCRCNNKVPENDDTKNKVTSLEIIVRMIDNKPYYEIKYKKVGEDYYHVGYSSFNIDNVLKWRDECFELVDMKMTNADRIRNMSDKELAMFIGNLAECTSCDLQCSEKCIVTIDECCRKHLEWLQSEAE